MNRVRPWTCAHFQLDSSALGTRVTCAATRTACKLRFYFCVSFAHFPCGLGVASQPRLCGATSTSQRTSRRPGSRLSNQVVSNPISTLPQTKFSTTSEPVCLLSLRPVLYHHLTAHLRGSTSSPSSLEGPLCFARKPAITSPNWSGILSPLQMSPISQHASATEMLYVDNGLNDFVRNSASKGHSRAGQT